MQVQATCMTFSLKGDILDCRSNTSWCPLEVFALIHVECCDAICLCSLEFMPGKQVGMSDTCFPDSLIGGIPNIYYYAANNPSEATIAKRRSYANTISCAPP